MKIEELSGLRGLFTGTLKPHPNPWFDRNRLADGEITYFLPGFEDKSVVINVKNLKVKRVPGDTRRFVTAVRGPKGKRDKIIALIDSN